MMSRCTGVWSEVMSPGGGVLWRREGGRRAGLLTHLFTLDYIYVNIDVLFCCHGNYVCFNKHHKNRLNFLGFLQF